MESQFKVFGQFVISKKQKEAFKSGELWRYWQIIYPDLYDEKDLQYRRNQAKYGYGFVSDLAAIFIRNATGMKCMQGSYGQPSNKTKNEIVKRIVSSDTWDLIEHWSDHHSQPPDLLVYESDESDYFFCEIKGPHDRLRLTQVEYFKELEIVSGKPVYMVYFTYRPYEFDVKGIV